MSIPRWRIRVAVFIIARALSADTRVELPVVVRIPETAVATWSSFQLSGGAAREGVSVELPDGFTSSGRVRADVLVRSAGDWVVASSTDITRARLIDVPRNERFAVLVRFESTPALFGWFDGTYGNRPILVSLLKNVDVSPETVEGGGILFAADGAISLQRDGRILRAVPAKAGLLCVGQNCANVSPFDDSVSVNLTGETRVLAVGAQEYEAHVRAAGSSVLRTREVQVSSTPFGPWLAISMPASQAWDDVVADLTSNGALQRLEGQGLLPLPETTHVPVPDSRKGILVRALVGPERIPHSRSEAKLYVFPTNASAVSSRIALAAVAPDASGVFAFPELGSGRFELKLFSPEATGESVVATLDSQSITDVVFNRGPVVHGRLVRLSAGSPSDPVSVEIVRQTPVTDVAAVVDWFRTVNAGEDGAFQIAVTVPGPYRLRASWGTSRGEIEFEVKDMKKDLDVGVVRLQELPSLRGSFAECSGGELKLTPLPDLSKPMTVPFFEFRRIAIASDGTFMAEGLASGVWLVGARCHGVEALVTPSSVNISETGVVFVDLRVTRPEE